MSFPLRKCILLCPCPQYFTRYDKKYHSYCLENRKWSKDKSIPALCKFEDEYLNIRLHFLTLGSPYLRSKSFFRKGLFLLKAKKSKKEILHKKLISSGGLSHEHEIRKGKECMIQKETRLLENTCKVRYAWQPNSLQ